MGVVVLIWNFVWNIPAYTMEKFYDSLADFFFEIAEFWDVTTLLFGNLIEDIGI